MTAAKLEKRDANTEPEADLNIDTWGAEPVPPPYETRGRAEAEREIAHYRGAVERNTGVVARIRAGLC